jgi:hypothetical protein
MLDDSDDRDDGVGVLEWIDRSLHLSKWTSK